MGAAARTTQVLANTDRKLVVQFVYSTDDGDELDQSVIVDISASAYNSSGSKAMTGVAVEKVMVTLNTAADATNVSIGWAATALYPFAHFCGKYSPSNPVLDYGSEWGGLVKDDITIDVAGDNSAGQGTPTGDIAVSTSNIGSGEGFTILLVMRKIF
tara:strand:- start:266 stop:736 length:471 start_codon:yes stop_codon:yes gene_type:complete